MRPVARLLPDGERLHLQHGPSDLILWAEGARARAYDAAIARFDTIIAEVVAELPTLRAPLTGDAPDSQGAVARRMVSAARPCAGLGFVTAMAAVAGAIADEVLAAMVAAGGLSRAYVNNGGDIALHLTPGTRFRTAIAGHDGAGLGRIDLPYEAAVRGIATSGRHGRSLSLGIADSVTVLAASAAQADVAATLVANAVDLPGDPAITRRPADTLVDDSDLGALLVPTACAPLSATARDRALAAGRARAEAMRADGLLSAAALFLQGHATTTHTDFLHLNQEALHA